MKPLLQALQTKPSQSFDQSTNQNFRLKIVKLQEMWHRKTYLEVDFSIWRSLMDP